MAKSQMARGALRFAEFATELNKEVSALGGNEETTFEAMKNDSGLAKEMAWWIVARVNGAKKLALKYLKLIAERIPVSTSAFARDSFFRNGPVKFWFGDNFKNWILSAIPETVPGFAGNLTQTKLTSSMYDREILAELGSPSPLTISEFAAIVSELLKKQPNGETGTLLTNGYTNIFYVKLPARNASHSETGEEDERVVAVSVLWYSYDREWGLQACGLDDGGWSDGNHVFSRS